MQTTADAIGSDTFFEHPATVRERFTRTLNFSPRWNRVTPNEVENMVDSYLLS